MLSNNRRVWVLLLLSCLLVGGCFLVGPAPAPGLSFSHALHNESKRLTCKQCHQGARTGDAAGLPTYGLCIACHDPQDEEKLPGKARLLSLFDEHGRYRGHKVASIPDEIKFSHAVHANANVTCRDCHGDVGASETIPVESAVSKKDCMDCHARSGKSNDCKVCHKVIDKNWAPPSHHRVWDVRHGQVARSQDPAIANQCSMCHNKQGSCDACHQTQAPRNHTHFWRQRGHGFLVSVDRASCATCHRTDFCTQCHKTTEPRSHRVGWGSPRNRHCSSCHLPLRGEGCQTCHKATPSHALAKKPPAGHHPAMNCRLCHGAGVPLPHPDNGTTCTTCHRF